MSGAKRRRRVEGDCTSDEDDLYTLSNFDAAIRNNFFLFVRKVFSELHPGPSSRYKENWHVEAMCYQLQLLARGELHRLAISVPPRHLKSITAAVAYPAWVLGLDPTRRVMVASYSAELSEKHSRDFRKVVSSPWFKRAFPKFRVDPKVDRALELATVEGGGRKAVSVHGGHTGFGATDIVIDDLMKATEARLENTRDSVKEFYRSLTTRLDDKSSGRIISIQQRLHEDDLTAHLLELGTYYHLRLSAVATEDVTHELYGGHTKVRRAGEVLFPKKEPLEVLETIRRDLGRHAYAAQYLQDPVAPDGCIILPEWLHLADLDCSGLNYDRIVQSWDTAVTDEPTSDYSVCITAGYSNGKWYVIHVWRGRLNHPALRKFIVTHADAKRADRVVIEKSNTGRALLQELREHDRARFVGYTPRDDKESRMIGQTTKLESERLAFVADPDWWPILRKELLAFPYGTYDDQVDALSQLLAWIDTPAGRGLLNRDPITNRPMRKSRGADRRPLPRLGRTSNSAGLL